MEGKNKIKTLALSDLSNSEETQLILPNEIGLDEIEFFVEKSQNVNKLINIMQHNLTQLTKVKSISLKIGSNIFVGSRGLKVIFQTLQQIPTLQELKINIDQGNHCGQYKGINLIEGLNSLKQLKSLNFKFNVFNNVRQNESECIGKSFSELTQLESLSITLYKYKGANNIHQEIQQSLKKYNNLKSLKLKIKSSYLNIFDLISLFNFEGVELPSLEEFIFKLKENSLRKPKDDQQIEEFKEALNIPKEFEVKARDQNKLIILGFFKQMQYFKQVKRLSIMIDNEIPNCFTSFIFKYLLELPNTIISKLTLTTHYMETDENYLEYGKQISQLESIQDLFLHVKGHTSVGNLVKFILTLKSLKDLKKLKLNITTVIEIMENEIEEENEQKVQLIDEKDIQECQSFLSKLDGCKFKINYYQRDRSAKYLQLFQILKEVPSLKAFYTNISFAYDNEELVSLDFIDLFNKCIFIKKLQLDFSFEEQDYNYATLFQEIKKLKSLQLLQIQFRQDDKITEQQCLAIRDSMQELNLLNCLLLNIGFEQSQENIELKIFFEGLHFLKNLEFLQLLIYSKTLNKQSSQYFSSQLQQMQVKKELKLQIQAQNEFCLDGDKNLCQSLESFSHLLKLQLIFQRDNISKDQVKDIISIISSFQQLQDLQLECIQVQINKEDAHFIKESLKHLKLLDTLQIKLDSIFIMYLTNLQEDLPFLTIFQTQFAKTKFKRKGLNRMRFNKMEEEYLDSIKENNNQLVSDRKTILSKEFELNRVRFEFSSLLSKDIDDLRWSVSSLKLPTNLEIRIPYISKSDQTSMMNFLSLFKQFKHLRVIMFKRGQKKALILPKIQVTNIFYKIKYLVSFTYK